MRVWAITIFEGFLKNRTIKKQPMCKCCLCAISLVLKFLGKKDLNHLLNKFKTKDTKDVSADWLHVSFIFIIFPLVGDYSD